MLGHEVRVAHHHGDGLVAENCLERRWFSGSLGNGVDGLLRLTDAALQGGSVYFA